MLSWTKALGLYVHVPFCVHKCGYCDFNSWAEEGESAMRAWLAAFDRQSRYWSERLHRPEVETIFLGGGTPSLLPPPLLLALGEIVQRDFRLSPGFEWTAECNPETLSIERLSALKEMGANRLSVGIQSFSDRQLERLERRARRRDNLQALELLQRHWPGRWSMDLMFGLPEQSLGDWEEDLDLALRFKPFHLSAYQLTLTTERSKSWKQGPEEVLLEFFDRTEARLEAAGLSRYEVSNFARPGDECRHNLKYWRLEAFLGLGPGAAGLLPPLARDLSGHHQKNPDRFEQWEKGVGADEERWLSPRSEQDHFFELLLMGLRLREGLPWSRFGRLASRLSQAFAFYETSGFLEIDATRLRCTPKGLRVLDGLLPRLYREVERHLSLEAAAWPR